MKRTHIILLIIGVVGVIGFIYFMTVQQVAKPYIMSSTANEPTLPIGTQVMASNLWEYKNGSFIVFSQKDPFSNQEYEYIFRLIASEGDTLEIKKGIVHLNSQNVDAHLTLKHLYRVHFDEISSFEHLLTPDDYMYRDANMTSDSLFVFLPDASANLGEAIRVKSHYSEKDAMIQEQYGARWNKDNFGPLIIPTNKLFVMGDNRDNAMDSRFIGLIDKDEVVASLKIN